MKKLFFLFSFLILNSSFFISKLFAQEKITFPSKDGITITADWYKTDDKAPIIILCHQAGFSRGEYLETAKKLNSYGFNCLAVDLRSGNEINGVKNETAALAKEKNKPTAYLDAEQDMIASIEYVFKKYNRKAILWGSSYSASLALKIGKSDKKIAAVIAFSPGEYFDKALILHKVIVGQWDKPVFVTSSKDEATNVTELLNGLNSMKKVQFIPQRDGVHGSRALWQDNKNHQEYWLNLKAFLNDLKK